MFKVSEIKKIVPKRRKRLGKGEGSNRGKNCGKGHKGQIKRSGKMPVTFVGGNKSLVRRSPKLKGFKAYDRKNKVELNTDLLVKEFTAKESINMESLLAKDLITNKIKFVRVVKGYNTEVSLNIEESENIHLTKGVKEVISGK